MDSNQFQIVSNQLTTTAQLAEVLANNLLGGEVIELVSDLAGGKTTFSRLLVKALGSSDQATSPSFTIENIYRCPKFNIHHFDFYRLSQPGIMAAELAEVLADKESLVIVEWAQLVKDILPKQRLTIEIEQTANNGRLFGFKSPQPLAYLLKGLNSVSAD